jgi:hypothetical protein
MRCLGVVKVEQTGVTYGSSVERLGIGMRLCCCVFVVLPFLRLCYGRLSSSATKCFVQRDVTWPGGKTCSI